MPVELSAALGTALLAREVPAAAMGGAQAEAEAEAVAAAVAERAASAEACLEALASFDRELWRQYTQLLQVAVRAESMLTVGMFAGEEAADGAQLVTEAYKRDVVRRGALRRLIGVRKRHTAAIVGGFRRLATLATGLRGVGVTGAELVTLVLGGARGGIGGGGVGRVVVTPVGDWPERRMQEAHVAWVRRFVDTASDLALRVFLQRLTGTLLHAWERGDDDRGDGDALSVCVLAEVERSAIGFVEESRCVLVPVGCRSEADLMARMAAALSLSDAAVQSAEAVERADAAQQAERMREAAAGDEYVAMLRRTGAVRPCPRCARLIERTEGCLHMTCRAPSCAHQFWWCCGRDYGAGFRHNYYTQCDGRYGMDA